MDERRIQLALFLRAAYIHHREYKPISPYKKLVNESKQM